MAIRRAVLVIADIGGYTHYMNWNRAHLANAQRTVAVDLASSAVTPTVPEQGFFHRLPA